MKLSNTPFLILLFILAGSYNLSKLIHKKQNKTTTSNTNSTTSILSNKTKLMNNNSTHKNVSIKDNNLIASYFNLLVRYKLKSLYASESQNITNSTDLKNQIILTSAEYEMEIKKYNKIISSLNYFLPNKNDKDNSPNYGFGLQLVSKLEFLLKMIIIFLKVSLLLIFINIFRWYEKTYSIITEYIKNRYSDVEDLTETEFEMDKMDDKFIFISGKPTINKVAIDDVFQDIFTCNSYAKLDRIVEVYNVDSKSWEPVKKHNIETMAENSPMNVDLFKENHLQISFFDKIVTFPRLFNNNFIGEVSIRNFYLSHSQIKSLTKKEPAILNELKADIFLSEQDLFLETDKDDFLPLKYIIVGNSIYFDPCINGENTLCKMRVSFFGYRCEELSVLSKALEGKLRTYRTPYDHDKEMEEDRSFSINTSTHMLTNIEFNYFTNIFCCCFYIDGSPAYISKDEYQYLDNQVQLFAVNWVKEAIYSKDELIYEKHEVGVKMQYLIRFIFIVVFFSLFYLFADVLTFLLKTFLPIYIINRYFLLIDLICSVILDLLIIITNGISHKTSLFFQLLFCFAIYIFLGTVLIIELFKLLEIIV